MGFPTRMTTHAPIRSAAAEGLTERVDAVACLDERVRQTPERAYERDFFESFAAEVGWRLS